MQNIKNYLLSKSRVYKLKKIIIFLTKIKKYSLIYVVKVCQYDTNLGEKKKNIIDYP